MIALKKDVCLILIQINENIYLVMRPNSMNGKSGDQGIENEFARFLQEVEGEKAKKLLSLAASQNKPQVAPSNIVVQQQNVSTRLNFLTDNFNPVLQLTNGPANQNDEIRQKTPLVAALLAKMQNGSKIINYHYFIMFNYLVDCFENNSQNNQSLEDPNQLKSAQSPSFMNPFPFNTVNAFNMNNNSNMPINNSFNPNNPTNMQNMSFPMNQGLKPPGMGTPTNCSYSSFHFLNFFSFI